MRIHIVFIRVFVHYLSYIVSTEVVVFDKNIVVLVYIALVINIAELAFGNGRRTQVLRELQRKVLRA